MRIPMWCGVLLWTLIVLYPDPRRLGVSVQRAWSPPVDAVAVRELAATLPDDPRAIEAIVITTLVPHAVPWTTYGVPWYIPSVAEALAQGQGDCQARALVLASLLQAKGVPATLVGSFDHLWVDYPGKHPTAAERSAVAIVRQQPGGQYHFRWPELIDWRSSWAVERAYFWDAMPTTRLILLLGGWLLIGTWAVLGGWRQRLARPRQRRGAPQHDPLTINDAG